jgi:hypothetical protein
MGTIRNAWHRIDRRWRVATFIVAVVIAGLIIALASVIPFRSETARRKVIETLAERFDAEVELADLRLHVFPRFRAEGSGLTIRHKGRRDVPPLIAVASFSAQGNVFGLLRRHISLVTIQRLDINIPPDHNHDPNEGAADAKEGSDTRDEVARTFVIDELVSTEAKLVIIPKEEGKHPKVWNIHHLKMNAVFLDGPMAYVATLDNAVPPGTIETSGSFGPWQSDQPGKTPLDGTFTFARADLGVFKGISGTLSARGRFEGILERIDIHGETDTPDFTVAAGGHPLPLHAAYHAVVDGTNGNTLLDKVDASFLQTSLTAKGGVIDNPGVDGRTTTLDVTIDKGRLEDVLRMAVKAPEPPMVGALTLTTTFLLPPGDRDVIEKLQLDGAFTIAGARFTSGEIQTKINGLSQRTRGKNPEATPAHVSSQFAGAFKLRNSRLTIPHVTFNVPGAAIRLSGTYGLVSEQIDFTGTAFTDAKISEMTTGFKSLLLKPVDLLFNKKDGGSAIPITIGGTRDAPSFGLDKGHLLKQ